MIHQPHGGVGGQVSDIEIQANEILRTRAVLNEILAKHTGKTDRGDRQGTRPRLLHDAPTKPRPTASSTTSCSSSRAPRTRTKKSEN